MLLVVMFAFRIGSAINFDLAKKKLDQDIITGHVNRPLRWINGGKE